MSEPEERFKRLDTFADAAAIAPMASVGIFITLFNTSLATTSYDLFVMILLLFCSAGQFFEVDGGRRKERGKGEKEGM